MKVKIKDIVIKNRIREDIGSLYRLKESMKNNGLINPITLTLDYELLAGYRRLQSARELGWDEIECNMISVENDLEKLEVEAAENITRKDFTEEEMIKLDEVRAYLTARGFKKLLLFLKHIILKLIDWIKIIFGKKSSL
ncbi:ParB N-terminal domain-containing protein [Spirochaetota bacterium]